LQEEILELYIGWAENHNEHKDEDTEDLEIPDSFDEIEFIDEEAFTIGCQDEIEEYEAIKDFIEELEDYGDFASGETIIAEDYFTEYCKELITDCGYISEDFPSWIAIDYENTADNMKQDYTEADYDGTTYLMIV
jgi:hypothetical protein